MASEQIRRAFQFARVNQTRIISAALIAAVILIVLGTNPQSQWLMFLCVIPLVVAISFPALSLPALTSRVDAWEQSFQSGLEHAAQKEGKFARYFRRPLYRGSLALWRTTEPLPNPHVRAGLRLGTALYFWAAMLAFLIIAAYVVVGVVLVLVVLAIVGWILSLQGGRESSGGYTRIVRTFSGRRKQEHFDESGQKVGESRTARTIVGSPKTEHFDVQGNKVGESKPTATLLGAPKIDHFDPEGNKTGESRPGTSLWGNEVVEHFDASGEKVGESRDRETLLGDIVSEHTGEAPHRPRKD